MHPFKKCPWLLLIMLFSSLKIPAAFSGLTWIWLVGCFGFSGPLRQYFSLYLAVSQREGGRGEKG